MAKIGVIQITVWLGTNRRIRIRADSDVGKNPANSAMDFDGFDTGATADGVKLLKQLCDKFGRAYPDRTMNSIGVTVNGSDIVPD